ncbi:MAG TPA: sigma-70 family RNA polymerase sigma factor [Candidatus Saccharimonadales bacterium]
MKHALPHPKAPELELPPEIYVDIPRMTTFNPYEELPVDEGFRRTTAKNTILKHGQEINLGKRMEAGVLASEKYDQLINEGCTDIRLLGELRALGKDGLLARDYFAFCNLRLVRSFAERSDYTNVPLADRIQMGVLGLMRALNAYDYTRCRKFSTFAVQYIRQAISREHDTTQAIIRKPVHVFGYAAKVRAVGKRLEKGLGRESTVEELAKETGMAVKNLKYLRAIMQEPYRLEAPYGDDDEPLSAFIVDEGYDTEESFHGKEFIAILRRQLVNLSDQEAACISYKFGLSGPPMTNEEIGKIYGVSRSRVQQIGKRALHKLSHPSRCLEDFL